jgi:hypothetical protein
MAQDLLDRFTPLHMQPINSTNVATLVLTSGGHRALKFPTTFNRTAYFAGVLSSLYNGSGFKVTLVWTMAATSPAIRWTVGFERQAAGVFSYASSSFATGIAITATAPTASNRATYSTLSLAGGATIDGLLALESYRVSVTRSGTVDGGPNVYLHRVIIQNLI